MGNMIGVGIFIYPSMIAGHLPHPIWFLLVWIIGGFIALSGALSSAEIASFYPEAGGDYAYLRNVYGERWAFLYGFLCFFVTFPGSIALGLTLVVHFQIASILGDWVNYVAFIFPVLGYNFYYYQLIAIALVILLTVVNHYGIHSSYHFQRFMTLFPVLFLIGIGGLTGCAVIFQYLFGDKEFALLSNFSRPYSTPGLTSLASALVPVYWTFSGWNSPLAMGAEIKEPEKIIPKAMLYGPIIVTLFYLLFASVFLAILPYNELQAGGADPFYSIGKNFIATFHSEDSIFLKYLPGAISLIIFFVVLGNMNSTMISGSRIYVAMSHDHLFWEKVGQIDPVRHTPITSLWLQSLWAIVLIIFVNKESHILNFAFIAVILLSILTISAIFIVRKRESQRHFLFKAFGYPFTPLLYICFSFLIFALLIIDYWNKGETGIIYFAIISIIIGIVAYELTLHKKKLK